MVRSIYQYVGYALCLSIALLHAADNDLGRPCKIGGLLTVLGRPVVEDEHKILHEKKTTFKNESGEQYQDIMWFTDNLDELIESAVLTAAVGTDEVFIRSIRKIEKGSGACVLCLAVKNLLALRDKLNKAYRKKVKRIVTSGDLVPVCIRCYQERIYAKIAPYREVRCAAIERENCLSCEYMNVDKQVRNDRWFEVAEIGYDQLVGDSYINVCNGSHPDCMKIEAAKQNEGFRWSVWDVIRSYVTYLPKRDGLTARQVNVNASGFKTKEEREKERGELRDLFNAYKEQLKEVAHRLSPKPQKADFKYYLNASTNKMGVIDGHMQREPLIKGLYNALCASQKEVEEILEKLEEVSSK